MVNLKQQNCDQQQDIKIFVYTSSDEFQDVLYHLGFFAFQHYQKLNHQELFGPIHRIH